MSLEVLDMLRLGFLYSADYWEECTGRIDNWGLSPESNSHCVQSSGPIAAEGSVSI